MKVNDRLDKIEKELKEIRESVDTDSLRIVIQETGNGINGIEILGKEHINNRAGGIPIIYLTGRYKGEDNTIQVGQSLPALQKAIEKYEKLFGKIK